jgi:tetraacyldisaccharide 4'-kinase
VRTPEFWYRRTGWQTLLLSPLAALYLAGHRWRQARARPVRAPLPVICVGNLVAGGAGKTPVVEAIASWLRARGINAHCLSRGYGGRLTGPLRVDPGRHQAADVGDEPLMLAQTLPVWIARDRVAGARAIVEAGGEAVVMDDGLQNPSLVKDLSIAVIDAEQGIGNGHVIPAGPLREPLGDGLARVQALVIMGDGAWLSSALGDAVPDHAVLEAQILPRPEADRLAGARAVAFAGIGRPEKFFETLMGLGVELVSAHPFPDHYVYSADEIMTMVDEAHAADARLVTTEKDQARLSAEARPMVEALPVAVEFADWTALGAVLTPLFPKLTGSGQ